MATSVEISRALPVPAAHAFRYLADLEDHSSWMADAAQVSIVSATRRGVGVELTALTRVGPLRTTDHMVVTEWCEGSHITVRHVGRIAGWGRLSVEPEGPDRCRVRWREALTFPGGPLGELIGRLAQPILAIVWRRNLARLEAHILERGPLR